ncbi:MAG: ATP-binding cassette domain-containing protein [Alphaproteobacteria bacterium]|nr:ATP-binding cassette domain-containing protein [Alphaproteobacteria bacterium]
MRLDVDITGKTFVTAAGGRQQVLEQIRFSLHEGDVAVIIGPSGCGKTTLLRVITGLDHDFQGEVRRSGINRTAMVFQEPRLLPWRSVEDNVRLCKGSVSEARLSQIFDILELGSHRHHFPRELSLGLARRAALARAFAHDGDFLVLDEPLASLDAALSHRLRQQIAALVQDRPLVTLLVTHSLTDALHLGDRLLFLSARPACIVADHAIAIPRGRRSAADITALKRDLAQRFARDLATPGVQLPDIALAELMTT